MEEITVGKVKFGPPPANSSAVLEVVVEEIKVATEKIIEEIKAARGEEEKNRSLVHLGKGFNYEFRGPGLFARIDVNGLSAYLANDPDGLRIIIATEDSTILSKLIPYPDH